MTYRLRLITQVALDNLSDNETRRLYDSQVSSGVAQVAAPAPPRLTCPAWRTSLAHAAEPSFPALEVWTDGASVCSASGEVTVLQPRRCTDQPQVYGSTAAVCILPRWPQTAGCPLAGPGRAR